MLVLQFDLHLSSFIQRGSQLWGYIQALFTMKDYISFVLHLLKYGLDEAKVWTVMGCWCPKFWLSKGEWTIIELLQSFSIKWIYFCMACTYVSIAPDGPGLALFLSEDFANHVHYHCSNHTAARVALVHLPSDISRYCRFGETLLTPSRVIYMSRFTYIRRYAVATFYHVYNQSGPLR